MNSEQTYAERVTGGDHPRIAEPWDSSAVFRELLHLSGRGEGAGGDAAAAQAVRRGAMRYVLSALHARDAVTLQHSMRVAALASGLAEHLGWDDRQRRVLELAALMHDVGKIGVPDDILYKPTSLGPAEMVMMDQHRGIGLDVLQACRADLKVLDVLSQYHRTAPASAAARSPSPGAAHQGARILSIADAYDAMTVNQVYRPKMSHREAAAELMRCAGSQFDATLVGTFVRWTEREGSRLREAFADAASHPPAPAWPALQTAAIDLALMHAHLYLVENLYDGFCLVDRDLQTVVFSQGARRMLECSLADVVSRPCSPWLLGYCDAEGKPLAESEHPLGRVFATGRPQVAIVGVQRPGGERLQVETYALPVLLSSGDVCGAVEIYRDLSGAGLANGSAGGTGAPRAEGARAAGRLEFRDLHTAATFDALTGVANRRSMETQLAWHLQHAQGQSPPEPFSVVFVDLDHFKLINDRFGHRAGDEVLTECAQLLRGETYSGELVARYGGEEFVVLCPDTPLAQAVQRAERLRIALGQLAPASLGGHPVSASLGVATLEEGDTAETLLARADEALYLAKRQGRNQTVSLTVAECDRLRGQPRQPDVHTDRRRGKVHEWFFVCLPRAVLVHKLGGFASDLRGMIRETSDDAVRFRLMPRRRGLFGFRGADVPVEVELRLSEEGEGATAETASSTRPVARLLRVDVSIRPVGLLWNKENFASRAANVLEELRRYLGIAHEAEAVRT